MGETSAGLISFVLSDYRGERSGNKHLCTGQPPCFGALPAILEKIVNDLLEVPGNKTFRDAITRLVSEPSSPQQSLRDPDAASRAVMGSGCAVAVAPSLAATDLLGRVPRF